MKKLFNTKLNEDIVVPLDRQITLVKFVDFLGHNFQLNIGVFGHCGDGNLHVNFMYNEEDTDETERAVQALHQLMEKVVSLDGAVGNMVWGLQKRLLFVTNLTKLNGMQCLRLRMHLIRKES